jgi:hypothetical protein
MEHDMPYVDRSFVLVESVPAGNSLAGRPGTCNFFRYCTPDTLATVAAAGYFNAGRDRLQAGDVVHVVGSFGGTPATDHYVFTSVPATGNILTVVEAA